MNIRSSAWFILRYSAKIAFALLSILFLSIDGDGQNHVPIYFIEVSSMDKGKYKFDTGPFIIKENGAVVMGSKSDQSPEQAFSAWKDDFKALPVEKQNILIYIHGMWGHRSWYQNDVINGYYQDVFSREDNPYGMVISLVWHSGISYWENVDHAYQVGKYFSQVLVELRNWHPLRLDVLSHSMGNRVFQGIYSTIEVKECYPRIFHNLYMQAADLEANIFEKDQPLDSIMYVADSIHIYVHQNDRSLGMSKSINKNDRLGLDTSHTLTTLHERICVINVSLIDDNEGIGPTLSNHRYFYSSPSVRNDMMRHMTGQNNQNRKATPHERYFILQPLEYE